MRAKFVNADWDLANADGKIESWERVGIAVLMDIRDELQKLNRLLGCPNFLGMPQTLREIQKNTHKPRKYVRKAKS